MEGLLSTFKGFLGAEFSLVVEEIGEFAATVSEFSDSFND